MIDLVELRLQRYAFSSDYPRKSRKKWLKTKIFSYQLLFINYFMYLCTAFSESTSSFRVMVN